MKPSLPLYLGLSLGLFAGCAGEANPTLAELAREIDVDNGVSLNGVSLNGVSLNGVSLNGVSLNGVSLNGVSLNGVSLNGVSLNGTELQGVLATGSYVSGLGFLGGELVGLLGSGLTLRMRIDSMSFANDAWWYRISYRTSMGWQPLCGRDSAGVAVEAVPLAGTWDNRQGVTGGGAHLDTAGQLTFGCKNAALGKCVALGYKPWWGGGWADHHQACVRMVRADYCGDGRSWTLNGRRINAYDDYRVQVDTEAWEHEAEWNAAGAVCVKKRRVLFSNTPACARERQTANGDCTTFNPWNPFRPGTLLVSEFEAQATAP